MSIRGQLTVYLCLFISCAVPIAFGQDAATRASAPIDWGQAEADRKAAETANAADVERTRAGEAVGIDATNLPVLLPKTGVVRSSPRFRSQKTAYAAAFDEPAVNLSLMGSATAVQVSPDDAPTADAAPTAGSCDFEVTEDGADCSFTRYGAAYVLRISCSEVDDPRCTDPAYLNSVAGQLIVVGGKKK